MHGRSEVISVYKMRPGRQPLSVLLTAIQAIDGKANYMGRQKTGFSWGGGIILGGGTTGYDDL